MNACVAAHGEAQRLRLGGELLAAREQLLVCAQRECPAVVANDCALWLPEVESNLSSVVLAVEGGEGRDLVDVRVFANDRLLTEHTDGRAMPLDPGSYHFRFEAAGYRPLTLAASMRQAEKNRIVRARLVPEATLSPRGSNVQSSAASADAAAAPAPAESTQSSVPVLTYVFGGVALAGFGAFTYFAVSGQNELDRLEETCGHDCTPAQVADGKRSWLIADVALGVGIASAATAVILLLTDGDDAAPPAAEAQARGGTAPARRGGASFLQPALLPRGVALQWTLRH